MVHSLRSSACALVLGLTVQAALAATPCPPPQVNAVGGSSASTTCPAPANSYTTNFPTNEFPLSEGGAWIQPDPTQTQIRVETLSGVHVAHGTQSPGGTRPPYDDSAAYLPALGGDHTIEATIFKSPSTPGSPNIEVELLLSWRGDNAMRNTIYGPTQSTGYELNINQNGDYLILGRYKGDELARAVSPPRPANGDKFKARFVNNGNGTVTITVWWNGVLLPFVNGNPYTDTTPQPAGFPGIGFYIDPGGSNTVFGYSSVTATKP